MHTWALAELMSKVSDIETRTMERDDLESRFGQIREEWIDTEDRGKNYILKYQLKEEF